MYEFDGAEIAPKVSDKIGTKNLDMVNVVPNPYRGYSKYENSPIDSRVKITNLPPECTITIFDMAGNTIRKIKKADESTYFEWDLKNQNNVPIASGLYLIHVKAPRLGEKVVRWYGIMHAIDLDSY
jgi:flagellar hook assembly protein FlgD